MADKFKAPRGTFDVLPEQSAQRRRLMRAAREIFGRAGYRNIVTPSFEDTALFVPDIRDHIALYRLFGRPKDLARVEQLERLIA